MRVQGPSPPKVAWTFALVPGQIAPPPLTTAVGWAITTTVLLHVELQPLALVNARVKVKKPEVPALTFTAAALTAPLRVALPVTDQR